MNELAFQAWAVKQFVAAGCFALRLNPTQPGTPDILVARNGDVAFVEMKGKRSLLSEQQKLFHEMLRNQKLNVHILRYDGSLDNAYSAIKAIVRSLEW